MVAASLVTSLALGGIFVLAGVGKLMNLRGTRQALLGFGLPQAAVGALAPLLCVAEIAVGLALIAPGTRRWGAIGAVLLLCAFVAGVLVNLLRGRRPDCNCFAGFGSGAIGTGTLVRNGAFLAAAVFVLATSAPAAADSPLRGSFPVSMPVVLGIIGGGILVVQSWILFGVLRQSGRLLRRVETLEAASSASDARAHAAPGLSIGAPAIPFLLHTADGRRLALADLLARGAPVLLLFFAPECAACERLWPDVAYWPRTDEPPLTVAVVSSGTDTPEGLPIGGRPSITVFVDPDGTTADAYHAAGTPSAVLVRRDGTIGSDVALGASAIRLLVERAGERGADPGNAPFSWPAEPPARQSMVAQHAE